MRINLTKIALLALAGTALVLLPRRSSKADRPLTTKEQDKLTKDEQQDTAQADNEIDAKHQN